LIADCAHYLDGVRQHEGTMDIARAAELAQREDERGFIWIGLVDPTPEELLEAQQRFGLNELAVEDARSFHLRPKVETYDEAALLFTVLRTARYVDETEEIEFGEVSIFLSERFVISVRQGEASDLHDARRRLERRPNLVARGTSSVLWAILDKIVDDYAPVIEGLENDVEEVEETVFGHSSSATERIYRLRREATDFYRAVHPLLGPLDSFQRGVFAQVDSALTPFFRDVNDHLQLVNEEVLGQRDSLAVVLQANMAVISLEQNEISVRQNEATKTLTVIATIFLPLTFITGFFGQNFGWLDRAIGSFWSFAVFGLGTLLVSCVGFAMWFRHSGLLGENGAGDRDRAQ
jgi:magnesium transporter